MRKIEAGDVFINGDDIFTVKCLSETLEGVWMCIHPTLLVEWGFDEKTILESIISEEKKDEKTIGDFLKVLYPKKRKRHK